MDSEDIDLSRYVRQVALPDFGREGQLRLMSSAVIIIGCGGLGIPALQYLVAAGVGKIGIVDGDVISLSNLQRQVLYSESDLGKQKVHIASKKLGEQNTKVEIQVYDTFLDADNALDILKPYDIIIDASDRIPIRYLINDACVILNKPFVYGSVYQYEGHVSLFNVSLEEENDRAINYRDLYPTPPAPEDVPNCAEGGILGVVASIIGSIQALECIKFLTGQELTLNGLLLIMDAKTLGFRKIRLLKDPGYKEIKALIDYEEFCGEVSKNDSKTWDLDVIDLQKLTQVPGQIELIDVRKTEERHYGNIGGKHIPLHELESRLTEIDITKEIVVYCRSGVRSLEGLRILSKHFPEARLFHLKNGVLDWKLKIDSDLDVL